MLLSHLFPTLKELSNALSGFASCQVVLINAIKDVAKALSDLIGATKGAASKPADDPSMYQLKGAAKVFIIMVPVQSVPNFVLISAPDLSLKGTISGILRECHRLCKYS